MSMAYVLQAKDDLGTWRDISESQSKKNIDALVREQQVLDGLGNPTVRRSIQFR